ncbi:hypothetical protein BD779DRAFT_1675421 [Infundibulicybe gibba]|nr:hypothetical protein BD779DRAFT_1675421 [Infundibulicybe gibba]
MTLSYPDAAFSGVVIEGIFYGAYAVLFVLYLVLRRHNNHALNEPLTLAQMLLFGLCTVSLCLDVPTGHLLVASITIDIDAANRLQIGSMVIFSIIDYLAQMILLYRCWIIWDKRWVVVAIPGFLALTTLAGGLVLAGLINPTIVEAYITDIMRPIGIATYSTSLATNALITSLIVTKILLTSQEVRPALGSNSNRSFRIATAMLIESGLLMLAFQLLFIILYQRIEFDIISGATTQIYGITPILLNIRVVMGTAYDKTTEKTYSLRFAHSEGAATQTTDLGMGGVGVQSRGLHVEPDRSSESTV